MLAVKKMVEEESIDCDFVLTRAIDVYLDDAHAQATREAYLKLTQLGAADLSDVEFVEGEPAEKVRLRRMPDTTQISCTKVRVAIWSQECQELFLLHSSTSLAIQASDAPSQQSRRQKRESPDAHACQNDIRGARCSRTLDHHHQSRYSQDT